MSSTTTSPNNRSVKFRGQGEREMATTMKPLGGDTIAKAPRLGTPKRMPKGMRKRARGAVKRGLISEVAMKKHMGGY